MGQIEMIKPCRKVYFATEKDANFYIKKLNSTSNRKIIPKRAYLCPKCNFWHLTSIKDNPYVITITNLQQKLAERKILIKEMAIKIDSQAKEIEKLKKERNFYKNYTIPKMDKF